MYLLTAFLFGDLIAAIAPPLNHRIKKTSVWKGLTEWQNGGAEMGGALKLGTAQNTTTSKARGAQPCEELKKIMMFFLKSFSI